MKFGPTDAKEAIIFATEELRADIQYEIMRGMKAAGVSRAELAKRIGVSAAWVSQILSDDANLTIESIAKVFLALGCQPKMLCTQAAAHFEDVVVENGAWAGSWHKMMTTDYVASGATKASSNDTAKALIQIITERPVSPRPVQRSNDNYGGDRQARRSALV
ncbi:helix-turn-helix domain-containing protein [Pararhizobium qamdonense]|uniref:helix-turn-helix domain-containing protein n=1 Tax=Pararhizobium qamdonense TaxID=3031126 RepID=UPI0023E13985|nr:helix-turn-helix transcriptional regulator [Pararhizobium qamdonense]